MNALRAVGDFNDRHLEVFEVFRLRAGGRSIDAVALPTTAIAKDLGVSPISAAALLRSMERHGWLTSAKAAWSITPLGREAALKKRSNPPPSKPQTEAGDDAA